MKVFLGGTCGGSKWRTEVINQLEIDYYNPVVDVWDENAFKKEEYEKNTADYLLFVVTPLLTGFYSIAEVVDNSNKNPDKTLFCVLDEDDSVKWDKFQEKSLNIIKKLVQSNGGHVFDSLEEVIDFLNNSL